MNLKLEKFLSTVATYPAFKAQFAAFCSTATADLNKNEYFPGVSFTADADAGTASLRVFDQDFAVRICVVTAPDPASTTTLAALAVYLPSVKGEDLMLWRTFFDSLGNVK